MSMNMNRNLLRLGVTDLGGMVLFLGQAGALFLRRGVRVSYLVDQLYRVGVRSLPTTLFAGGFVGAILALQLNAQLVDYGAQGTLGGLATSTIWRNIGPVLIAFMLSGRVGGYTAAELSAMRVTEQMDAVRCLGANPMEWIVLPRLIAIVIGSFLLLVVGLMVAITGGIAIATLRLGISPEAYVYRIPEYVTGFSIGMGLAKSLLYGVVIGTIACYRGYHASGGAAGVGRAVKQAAVNSLVTLIVLDFLLTFVASWLGRIAGWGSV